MGLLEPTMWDVYEYLRNRFMRTGDVPKRSEIFAEMPGIDPVTVNEGVIHFHQIIKGWPGYE